LYRLIREGFNAVLAAPNTDAVDIYVADKNGKPFAVQVKTKANSTIWRLNKKHETIEDPRLCYAFVDIGKDFDKGPPDLFVVPSDVVARAVRESHKAWHRTPTKKGTPKKHNDLRDIAKTYPRARYGDLKGFPDGWMEQYRENWHFLKAL
jgi:hypothetical protein